MNDSNLTESDFFWIKLPDQTYSLSDNFTLDPEIPLPLEKKDSGEECKLDEISWDGVVSAILLLLSFNPKHHDADYYRKLTLTLKPEIMDSLKAASASSLEDADFGRAEHVLLALLGLAPNNSTVLHDVALFYDKKAKYMRSIEQYEQALDFEKSASLAYENLLSENGTKYNPRPIAWFNAGKFYYRIGNFNMTLEMLEHFLTFDSDKAEMTESRKLIEFCRDGGQATVTYEEAYQLLNKGNIQEGYEKAKEFYQYHSENWPASFLLGWALRLLEDWEQARKTLLEAHKKGCNESELFNEIALCSREIGDYAEAKKMLEEGLKRSPQNTKIISNLGIVNLELGEPEEARRWFQIALTLEPDDAVSLKYLQEYTNNQACPLSDKIIKT